ncbi:hypothetical protein BJX96DRAFT_39710 [Aspergillus floccosus]
MQGYSQKRARAQACKNCRVRKRRCVPAISGNACRLCQTLSVPCSLDTEYDPVFPRRGMHQDQSTASTTPISIVKQIRSDERQDPVELFRRSRDLQAELVSLYFRFIHNVAHTLFHEIRFMRSVHAEKEPTLLVYFMSALSARYSTNRVFEGQAPSLRGKSFFEEAKRLIYEKLTSPSLETVQAFILAGTFAGGEGDLPAKHVYMELARSHSEASSLWESRTVLSAVIQEERRRTWLTVLIVGEWTAADISIGHRHPQIGVGDLPLFDDVVFQRYGPEELTYPDHPASDRCEMWTQMAKMLRFFSSTSDLLRRLSCAAISFAAYCEEVPMLSKCLDQWNDGLPQNLVYNVDNLGYLASQGLGRTFLAMHIGYYHLRQILFFPFLGSKVYQSLDTSAHLHYAISECKRSAHTVSDIVKLATEKADCELNYFLYGHIVVVSSCVHLHTLLLSDEEQESTIARQCLISNFEFLMTLKLSWPVVEISVCSICFGCVLRPNTYLFSRCHVFGNSKSTAAVACQTLLYWTIGWHGSSQSTPQSWMIPKACVMATQH